jgi:quinohemoprotein amine dehydrogenase
MQMTRVLFFMLLAMPLLAQMDEGIPVTDPVVVAKCGSCHTVDSKGIMQRLSWERATPEGWEEALKRMIRSNQVVLTPPEARAIVKYLSATHGLAPQETKPIMYDAERRIHDEAGIADENLMNTCAKCHDMARALSWRRSLDEWKEFAGLHVAKFKFKPNAEALVSLGKVAPLHTADWAAWSSRGKTADASGRWLVTAHLAGHGQYCGEMTVSPSGGDGEFLTQVKLTSVRDGSTITRAGRIVVFDGYQWRGRSKGAAPNGTPDDVASEARETMWISPDSSTAEGRWFWGQYQEFGYDVKMQRAGAGTALLAVDVQGLKTGSQAKRVRIIGDHLPANVKAGDVSAGAGVKVLRIVSSSPGEVVAELDVAADAVPGKRDLTLGNAKLSGAFAVYDRVDYVKVTPDSSMAAFGSTEYPRGYEQFEAIGYQRGPDGRLHTPDDLELGPVDATWSMEIFYETDASKHDLVGKVSQTGFFTPAAESAGTNYDIWVIATDKNDLSKDGKPLVGKGYVVVTVPTYMFEGRKYVRELDRWIEDGRETR